MTCCIVTSFIVSTRSRSVRLRSSLRETPSSCEQTNLTILCHIVIVIPVVFVGRWGLIILHFCLSSDSVTHVIIPTLVISAMSVSPVLAFLHPQPYHVLRNVQANPLSWWYLFLFYTAKFCILLQTYMSTCLLSHRCLLHFSPAGWDNTKKISILFENMTSMKPDDAYGRVISRPSTHKVTSPFRQSNYRNRPVKSELFDQK